jgi:hypothetical protein
LVLPDRIELSTSPLPTAAVGYDIERFSITTDTQNLIANDLPWRQRQADFDKTFPQKDILVVVTAPTTEDAELATGALENELAKRQDLFQSVVESDGGKFFRKNGLLFESLPSVKESMPSLSNADVLVGTLVADPSLRRVMKVLALSTAEKSSPTQLVWPLSMLSPPPHPG